MGSILEQFVEYAGEWVSSNIENPSERERLLGKIKELPLSVYPYIDKSDAEAINDFVRCVYVIESGYSDWDGFATLQAYFPLDSSVEPHVKEMNRLGKLIHESDVPVVPISKQETAKSFSDFVGYLSILPMHYSDIKSPDKRWVVSDADKTIENHFLRGIVLSDYSADFLPLWLISRRKLYEEKMTLHTYVALLQSIEAFITNIYLGSVEDFSGQSHREMFGVFACDVKNGFFEHLPWQIVWHVSTLLAD